jgi:hypothetical protein
LMNRRRPVRRAASLFTAVRKGRVARLREGSRPFLFHLGARSLRQSCLPLCCVRARGDRPLGTRFVGLRVGCLRPFEDVAVWGLSCFTEIAWKHAVGTVGHASEQDGICLRSRPRTHVRWSSLEPLWASPPRFETLGDQVFSPPLKGGSSRTLRSKNMFPRVLR